jgi:hypothetical protein
MLIGSGSVLCPVGTPPDGPSRQCPERASGLASRPNQTGVCAADLDHETPALRHMLEELICSIDGRSPHDPGLRQLVGREVGRGHDLEVARGKQMGGIMIRE